MVARVREGVGLRAAARECRVTLSTVQRWVARAGDRPPDQVDWADQPSGCRVSPQRMRVGMEERVLKVRKALRTKSDLGEFGAAAIHRELQRRLVKPPPSVRTIGRVLERHGALDGRRRLRHTSPPRGWSLPKVAAGKLELDRFDAIEDLVIRGGHDVNVLTGISLHGGPAAARPAAQVTSKFTVECLLEHWREFGLPGDVKFDNGTAFQGAHAWPDTFGRVTRTCLSLGVTPVFAPPLSRGFPADIEAFNGRWQDAVWSRFTFRNREQLVAPSRKFLQAHHARHAVRIEEAPLRRTCPADWRANLQQPLKGTVIFVRVTSDTGSATVLGHTFAWSSLRCHRLVRAEVNLTRHEIRFPALRRKDPHNHLLLAISFWQNTIAIHPRNASTSDLGILTLPHRGVHETDLRTLAVSRTHPLQLTSGY